MRNQMLPGDGSVSGQGAALDSQASGQPFFGKPGEGSGLGFDVAAAIHFNQDFVQPTARVGIGPEALTGFLANPFLFAGFVTEISEIEIPLLNHATALSTLFRHGLSSSEIPR